ncbi:hypothetical protein SV7mr_49010 [Stieleria bergensis]|uniref:Uncharacterized protein n=1 Tax=Stieleria bergensis TaxID=2528025 RepID=A0A517T1V9_9BACT|nr:hypothetical protein SV7mr_49010 [Planctomycetes bacterium SV_7m_r]
MNRKANPAVLLTVSLIQNPAIRDPIPPYKAAKAIPYRVSRSRIPNPNRTAIRNLNRPAALKANRAIRGSHLPANRIPTANLDPAAVQYPPVERRAVPVHSAVPTHCQRAIPNPIANRTQPPIADHNRNRTADPIQLQRATGPAIALMIPALPNHRQVTASHRLRANHPPPNPIGRVRAATTVPIARAKAGLNLAKVPSDRVTALANRHRKTAADRANRATAPGSGPAAGNWSIATAKIPANRRPAPEPTTDK